MDKYVDYHAMFSGNPQALLENLKRQRGGRVARSSEGEELRRRMEAGEKVQAKANNPEISELVTKPRKKARVLKIQPAESLIQSIEAMFGEDRAVPVADDGTEAIPVGSPVKPLNSLIATLSEELRRER